jgi:hypothetical protein
MSISHAKIAFGMLSLIQNKIALAGSQGDSSKQRSYMF